MWNRGHSNSQFEDQPFSTWISVSFNFLSVFLLKEKTCINKRNLNTVIMLDWVYVVYGAIFISAPGGDEQNQIKMVRKRNVTTFYEDLKKNI